MAESREFRFHIDIFTPDTLPMARLSEYLADLSVLLGNKEHVHFLRVEEAASSNLAYVVDLPAVPKTKHRLQLVRERSPNAPPEALRAFDNINAKLIEDGSSAEIESDAEAGEILIFPGNNAPPEEPAEVFGPIVEAGTIDGQIVRVGGFDKTIPVHMRSDKVIHYCTADEGMARRLGPFILGQPIRVFGEGKWFRDEHERWKRKIFTITDYQELQDVNLTESVARLRAISGPLQRMTDPLGRLDIIRHGPEGSGKSE